MSDSEDPLDAIDEGGDDLFGDEDEDEAGSPAPRVLDDDDLASDPDDDAEPRERHDYGSQQVQETKERVVMAVTTYRHRIPKPQDDTVSLPCARLYFLVVTEADKVSLKAPCYACAQVH